MIHYDTTQYEVILSQPIVTKVFVHDMLTDSLFIIPICFYK